MTAPLTKYPPWIPIAAALCVVVLAVAIPFARRPDWISTVANLAIFAVSLAVWGSLVFNIAQKLMPRQHTRKL
jgi:hypothetical protein